MTTTPGEVRTASYLLMLHLPDGPEAAIPADPPRSPGLGWRLVGLRGGLCRWSIDLAARGAAPRAEPAVAQAVAVRVLTDEGITVYGWVDLEPLGRPGVYRAALEPSGQAAARRRGVLHRRADGPPRSC